MQIHTDTKSGQATSPAEEHDHTDWKAELERRWQALGRKILVVEPARPPKLREVLAECTAIAIVWALVQNEGNLTGAARWLHTGRRVVRECFRAWRRANPTLVPMPAEVFQRWSERYEGDRR